MNDESVLIGRSSEFTDAFARGNIGAIVRALTPPGQLEPTQEQIDAMNQEISSRNDKQALAALLRSPAVRVGSPEELRSNTVPTLAVIGENDYKKKDVDAMAAVMANLEVVVIPGADHGAAMRDPLFLEALLEFLAKHRQVASDR